MITAYLTLCVLAFGPLSCWPERAMGQFDTEAECWSAIEGLKPSESLHLPTIESRVTASWRCGENA